MLPLETTTKEILVDYCTTLFWGETFFDTAGIISPNLKQHSIIAGTAFIY